MTEKPDRLNITNLPSGYKAKISDKAKKLGLKQGELVAKMFDAFEQLDSSENHIIEITIDSFKLDDDREIKEVKLACKNSRLTLTELATEGLLQRARYFNSIAEKQAKFDEMTDDQLSKSTIAGAAYHRISEAVEHIKNHNDNSPEQSDRVCITKGMVFKLTGSNKQTIKKFFEEHSVMISDANNKYNLTDADNRKGKGFDFKELLKITQREVNE